MAAGGRSPRVDLRTAFRTAVGSSLSAQQVFTNRVEEAAAFKRSVAHVRGAQDKAYPSPVLDRGQPRTNVLCYYGISGIGKTRLSVELQTRLEGGELKLGKRPVAALRIDLAEPGAEDFEDVLIRIRASLGQIGSHWPAFDLAFNIYWERAHPGEPLQEYLRKSSSLRRVAGRIQVAEQMAGAVTFALGGVPVAGATLRLGQWLYEAVAKAVKERHLLRNCPLFKELITAAPDNDTLSYLTYLLAWDLEQQSRTASVVVFIDTFEVLASRETREFERLLQRLIFLMPNVLFVITGRNRLDWADLSDEGQLDYVGSERWPFLTSTNLEEPRQHLVGYLSEHDCEAYLSSALLRDGAPAISAELRHRITSGSQGWPLYLDISVTHYVELTARRQTPEGHDFQGPFPALVVRMMRDLNESERTILRGAAILSQFDGEYLRSTVGRVGDAPIIRFLDRPFLERVVGRPWPYALHAALRGAIRQGDHELPDSWSDREWRLSASRATEYLGALADQSIAGGDRGTVLACFTEAHRLSAEFNGFDGWLVRAAEYLVACGLWDSIAPEVADTKPATTLGAFDAILSGILLRRTGALPAAADILAPVVARTDLPPEVHNFALLHLAHATRNLGRYAEAASNYDLLAKTDSTHASIAKYWLADFAYLQGRFDDAATNIGGSSSDDGFLRGEILRLRGHIDRVNARFSEAEENYRDALRLAEETNSISARGKALTDLAQTQAWTNPRGTQRWLNEAFEVNEAIRNYLEVIKLHAVRALICEGPSAWEDSRGHVERALELVETYQNLGGRVFALTSQAFIACVTGRRDDALRTGTEIDTCTQLLGGYRYWAETVDTWIRHVFKVGAPSIFDEHIQWRPSRAVVAERWRRVLDDRRVA
jgi:tetratricopeptide (TPR) repeat protein